jgi:hypothetical protein
MKRSDAPSHKIPSRSSKKPKLTKAIIKEPSGAKNEMKPLKVSAKINPPAPINSKQQKAFHFLISAASYNSVLEGNTDSMDGIRDLCYKFYHGFDEDNIGMAANFLEGNGKFGVLWDDGRIASGFGHLSGLTHAQLSHYIQVPTLSKRNLITGRQIHDKAKACILEAKKYLALWMEFLVDGKMPSGMNEDNALQFVMKRAVLLTSSEVVGDEDEEEEVQGKLGCKLSHHIFVCVLTFILTYG